MLGFLCLTLSLGAHQGPVVNTQYRCQYAKWPSHGSEARAKSITEILAKDFSGKTNASCVGWMEKGRSGSHASFKVQAGK